MPTSVPSIKSDLPDIGLDNRHGRAVTLGIVHFILNAGGRIFQSAILYLLEGLIKGLRIRFEKTPLQACYTPPELTQILSLSRISGLPEISNDLLSLSCQQLCHLVEPNIADLNLPGYNYLQTRIMRLQETVDFTTPPMVLKETLSGSLSLEPLLKELKASEHGSIQGTAYAPACESVLSALDRAENASLDRDDLFILLQAFWDEAERREFIRPVVMHLPPLLLHPVCIRLCVDESLSGTHLPGESLVDLLSKALHVLQKSSKGRSYILPVLMKSLRQAIFTNPPISSILPVPDFVLEFINDPPAARPEFLFEMDAAGRLAQVLPHRAYSTYYGQREWHAYASFMDLLNRFPSQQKSIAKDIFHRLVKPWGAQEPPIPIKSSWKNTLQLQTILLLSSYCIDESEADTYLDSLMHALVVESWPRFRYLLEWIVARIYCQFPGKSSRILDSLDQMENFTPLHMASLMKLGLLLAPIESEEFVVKFATRLNCFSASPKVQIRHEANFAFPKIFDLAESKGWHGITRNPALVALNTFIRQLDKFHASPWTIRTLKLDAVVDYNIVKIFQGRYLSIESPEPERVTYEDFIDLQLSDEAAQRTVPPARVVLGNKLDTEIASAVPLASSTDATRTELIASNATTFLQTKAGFDLDSLHPSTGSPSTKGQRPSSVILVASLIDNPTNLGGLSRISESFGLEALYIDDIKKIAHKDFKATSVTSEKHFPIRALKIAGVPEFLIDAKTKGYEVVGIEQTDRSGMLGDEGSDLSRKDIGTLPKKCVLVLGSEKGGITPEVLAVIDRCVEIKTVGVTRSLNVQTAGGIAVYEWWREWGRKM